jgi:hypothetical protein
MAQSRQAAILTDAGIARALGLSAADTEDAVVDTIRGGAKPMEVIEI